MKNKQARTPADEAVSLTLSALYESYGYKRIRMQRFEEYALYLENKRFLQSGHITPFSTPDGRLMALRPDVTLSVMGRTSATEDSPERVYYRESVYRTDSEGDCKEIGQVGLEMLGGVDLYGKAEVTRLAAESLMSIQEECHLTVSHMGLVGAVLDALQLTERDREYALSCLAARNAHGMGELASRLALQRDTAEGLIALADGTADERTLCDTACRLAGRTASAETAAKELLAGVDMLRAQALPASVDFSTVGDAEYYDGIVFFGYLAGVPRAILTGGEYTRLAKKFGKSVSAMGFAVYVSDLVRYLPAVEAPTADVALLYGSTDDPAALLAKADALRGEGLSVLVIKALPRDAKVGKIIKTEGGSVC